MHIFLVFTANRNQLPKLFSFFHILITDGHCVVYLLYYMFDLDLSHIILRNNLYMHLDMSLYVHGVVNQ